MSTLTQLIRRNKQRPIRKLFIERRLFPSGAYEGSFTQRDNIENVDRIMNWGQATLEINNQPGQINNFQVSSLNIRVENSKGFWNVESDPNSLWFPAQSFIRNLSKIRIQTAYLDDDGTEVGLNTDFEGVLDRVIPNDNFTANLTVLSYTHILTRFDISDLSLTGNATVSTIVDAIMNQSKITEFIPFVAATPDVDLTVDQSTLTGSYWDVLKFLAFRSNSIPSINGNVFAFTSRTPSGSVVFDFRGIGDNIRDDILPNFRYDDEGLNRIKLKWIDSSSGITLTSSRSELTNRFLESTQRINLSAISDKKEKKDLLRASLREWEEPKPIIEFNTRYLINLINPLDRITVSPYVITNTS